MVAAAQLSQFCMGRRIGLLGWLLLLLTYHLNSTPGLERGLRPLRRRVDNRRADMDNGKKFVFDIALLETNGNYLSVTRSSFHSICDFADIWSGGEATKIGD